VSVEAKVVSTVTLPVALTAALAVNVSVPTVTVAPPTALFAETVPIELAFVVVPSVVVPAPVVQTGVVAPLVAPAIRHPPPVHFCSCPFVSTTSEVDV
jgi:hypothetical protein